MNPEYDEKTYRLLVLLKLDCNALYNRITTRKREYIHTFSLHRTRDHFKDVFEARLHGATPDLIVNLPVEIIYLFDQFYNLVDDMFWYLKHTQDMGATVEDKVNAWIKRLASVYSRLDVYLDAALQGRKMEEDEVENLKKDLEIQGEDISGL